MVESLVLIEGGGEHPLDDDELCGVSLSNAKHVIVGEAPGARIVVHVAATSLDDLRNALLEFGGVSGVGGVVTLALWPVAGER